MLFSPVRRQPFLSAAMAAAREIVVLSSSPPRTIPDSDIVVTPPSLRERLPTSPTSPDLPSLPDLLRSKPSGLKSGSRAAEIPDGASLGFGSVASLLKGKQISLSEENNDDLPEMPVEKETPPKRTKAVRKSRTAAPADNNAAEPTKLTEQEGYMDSDSAVRKGKAPKPRQPRTKKAKESEAAGKEGMEVGNNWSKGHAEAQVDSSATEALKKRRANSRAHVQDLLPAIADRQSTDGLPAAAEPAVVPDRSSHETELSKTKKSKRGPPKNASYKAAEANPGKAPRSRPNKKAPDENKPVKKAPKARKATSAVSAHFSRENSRDTASEHLPESSKNKPIDAPLDLDHAMDRRRSWTPLEDTSSKPPIETMDSLSEPLVSSGQRAHQNQNHFASLLGGFEYHKSPQQGANVEGRAEDGEAFTKRRKLEMIPNPVPPVAHKPKKSESKPAKKPAKEKAPVEKKPKTITELATAAYRNPPAEITLEVDTRVSEFFAPRPSDPPSETAKETASAPPEKPKRARKKSPSKASIEKAKKKTERAQKKAKLATNKLLSPGAALLKYNEQQVLFGTSSQLVREESPTFLRQVQQALKESEAMPMAETSPGAINSKFVSEGGGLSLLGKRKGLWTAASRNLVDESFEVYDPRAEDSQTANEVLYSPLSEDTTNGEAHPGAQPQDSSGFVDIEEYDDLTKRCSEIPAAVTTVGLPPRSPPCPSVGPAMAHVRPPLLSTISDPSHSATRNTSIPLQRSPSPKQLSGARAISTSVANRRHVAGSMASESGVASEIRASGSSLQAKRKVSTAPRKLPQGLIATPDTISQEPQPSGTRQGDRTTLRDELPQGLITTPKKVARKKGTQDQGWVQIDEIEDSAGEITPSPPRRRKIPSVSPKLQLSPSGRDEGSASISVATRAPPSKRVSSVPSEEQLAAVFPSISSAIKSGPPSARPNSPTWHERILLYDPVVVEDLSEWLNEQGVRMHVEVPVKEKKTKKKRGKKAKGDQVDEVENDGEDSHTQGEKLEVKEVPLQPWIVQRWCEEHSVCCIWKDTSEKRKGWKARSG